MLWPSALETEADPETWVQEVREAEPGWREN